MELIDKKPLLRSLVNWQMSNFAEVGHEREYNLLDSIIKGIENEPTVEVKEVVHREWIEHGEDTKGNNPIECPMSRYLYARLYPKNFCPNCGADMRKKV